MGIPFVDLQAQYRSIESEVQTAISEVLRSGAFILGPHVERFEHEFAAFLQAPARDSARRDGAVDVKRDLAPVRHAVGVGSGLDALRLALTVLGIGPGDEVVVPANTFIATALAVSAVGARPVLVDCDPHTYNIDASALNSALTPRTRAIIPVHFAGQPADMDPILKLAQSKGLAVVEDAAQAHGALYKGKACGIMGTMGCFSFYPGKNLGAYGDGGMIVTDDADLAQRLRRLRNYGQREKYDHTEKGLNARLDALQAAILSVKLRRLPQWNASRAAHAQTYRHLLRGVGDLSFQQMIPDCTSIYHLFLLETDRRDLLQAHLKKAGIETGIHYPKPIHLQPAYGDLGYHAGSFPCAERSARRTLSLPMYAELTQDQIRTVTDQIAAFFSTAPVNIQ